jgi:hypothetical protein
MYSATCENEWLSRKNEKSKQDQDPFPELETRRGEQLNRDSPSPHPRPLHLPMSLPFLLVFPVICCPTRADKAVICTNTDGMTKLVDKRRGVAA